MSQLCGIYQIQHIDSGKLYVGSSKHIRTRWQYHRRELRMGISNCRYLQNAWTKHGEDAFAFSVIEECLPEELEVREQFYIDTLKPVYNSITDVRRRYSAEAREKIAAAVRARAALITHCPKGHAYDEANTHRNKKWKRICRACANIRVKKKIASETVEQREARRARDNENYRLVGRDQRGASEFGSVEHLAKLSKGQCGKARSQAQRDKIRATLTGRKATPEARANMSAARKGRVFSVEHRENISAALKGRKRRGPTCPHGHPYDETNTLVEKCTGKLVCRTCRKERKRVKYIAETEDQKAIRLAQKRRSYHRHGDENRRKMRERYRLSSS